MSYTSLDLGESQQILMISGKEFNLGYFVSKVVEYRYKGQVRLFESMNSSYIASLLSSENLTQLEQRFKDNNISRIGIIDFVRVFLSTIEHNEEETLFLTIGLVDFFRTISQSIHMATTIVFPDITTAVCDKVGSLMVNDFEVQTLQFPPPRRFKENEKQPLDFKPPVIFENNIHKQTLRLQKGKIKTDSSSHINSAIKQAVYAKEIKKIIVLDSLDDKVSFYDLDCNKTATVSVKNNDDEAKISGIIIFGIAWSPKQQRLGACLKNFSLSFWDASSDFTFEKNFYIHGQVGAYQNSIWWLPKHEMWLTCDDQQYVYSWDIQNEKTLFSLHSAQITQPIFNILELSHQDLIAIGSLDKQISIWNINTQTLLFFVQVSEIGIHSLAYLNSFQLMVTAGYENNISLFSIDAQYMDSTLIGKLKGHTSMISCLEVIEGTPMVISADDQGIVRLWDIRHQTCLQTYEYGSGGITGSTQLSGSGQKRTQISCIIDIVGQGQLALIGSRLSLLNFEDKDELTCGIDSTSISFLPAEYALRVESSSETNELLVCTTKNLKIYDLLTGRCKSIIQGLLENEVSDDIAAFKPLQQSSLFIIANSKGQISLHNRAQNGQKIASLASHNNEITHIQIDYVNKLLISAGWDSNIIVQTLPDNHAQAEIKRTIQAVNYQKGVNLLEVSVYHNVIFTSTANVEKVFVFDYEYNRLLNYIEFPAKVEPTALCVLQCYPVLFVATSDSMLYCVHFLKKEAIVTFELLAVIDLYNTLVPESTKTQEPDQTFITKQSEDLLISNFDAQYYDELITQNASYNNSKYQNKLSKLNFPSSKQSSNRNSLSKQKPIQPANQINREKAPTITKLLPEFQFERDNSISKAILFVIDASGFITQIDLAKVFAYHCKMPYVPHANTWLNYNPLRKCSEDFRLAISKFSGIPGKYSEQSTISTLFTQSKTTQKEEKEEDKQQQSQQQQQQQQQQPRQVSLFNKFTSSLVVLHVQAHKDSITSIQFMAGDLKHLVTSSLDSYVRIWTADKLEQIASFNVNHPLPISWHYKVNELEKSKKKVIFAVRILDIINKKYSKEMSRKFDSSTRIMNFMKKLMGVTPKNTNLAIASQPPQQSHQRQQGEDHSCLGSEQVQIEQPKPLLMMKDCYSVGDLSIKKPGVTENLDSQGISLKRMEVNKRVAMVQKTWKNTLSQKEEEQQRENARKIIDMYGKGDDRETILNFLDPNYRLTILNTHQDDEYTAQTQLLLQKLDAQRNTADELSLMQAKNQQTKLQGNSKGIKKQNSNANNVRSRTSIKSDVSQVDVHSMLSTIQDEVKYSNSKNSLSNLYTTSYNNNYKDTHHTNNKLSHTQQQNTTNQATKHRSSLSEFIQNNTHSTYLQLGIHKPKKEPNKTPESPLKQAQPQGFFTLPYEKMPSGNNQQQHVKEPKNFEKILDHTVSPQVQQFVTLPDFEETKIRVDAFPQTTAMMLSMGGKQLYSGGGGGSFNNRNNSQTHHKPSKSNGFSITRSNPHENSKLNQLKSSARNTKSESQNTYDLYFDQRSTHRSRDVYSYAREREIISNSPLNKNTLVSRMDSQPSTTITSSHQQQQQDQTPNVLLQKAKTASQIAQASSSKLHEVLSGLNQKLKRSKRAQFTSLQLNNHQDSSLSSSPFPLDLSKKTFETNLYTQDFINDSDQIIAFTPKKSHSNLTKNTKKLTQTQLPNQLSQNNQLAPPTFSQLSSPRTTSQQLFFPQKLSSRNQTIASSTQAASFFPSPRISENINNKLSQAQNAGFSKQEDAHRSSFSSSAYFVQDRRSLPSIISPKPNLSKE